MAIKFELKRRHLEKLEFNGQEVDPETSIPAMLVHDSWRLKWHLIDVNKLETKRQLDEAIKKSNPEFSEREKQQFKYMRRHGYTPILKPFNFPRLYEVNYPGEDSETSQYWRAVTVAQPRLFSLAEFAIESVTETLPDEDREKPVEAIDPLHHFVAFRIPIQGAEGVHVRLTTHTQGGEFAPDSSDETANFTLGLFNHAIRMLKERKQTTSA